MNVIIPHKQIDRKFLVRLIIFLVVAIVIAIIVIRDVIVGDLSWWLAVIGFVVGIVGGYILGRILTVKWHEDKQKAVMEVDTVSFIAIGIYFALRIGGNFVLAEWLTGVALSTLSLALLGGIMLGRFLGLRISIQKLIEKNT